MHDVCSDVEGEGEGIWFHFGEVCVVWFVGSKVGWYIGREVEGERGRVEMALGWTPGYVSVGLR